MRIKLEWSAIEVYGTLQVANYHMLTAVESYVGKLPVGVRARADGQDRFRRKLKFNFVLET